MEEGWSAEYFTVEKKTDFAAFWEKMLNFCIRKFSDF